MQGSGEVTARAAVADAALDAADVEVVDAARVLLAAGAVHQLLFDRAEITATVVEGDVLSRVVIRRATPPEPFCTCGDPGPWCRHAVAAAEAFGNGAGDDISPEELAADTARSDVAAADAHAAAWAAGADDADTAAWDDWLWQDAPEPVAPKPKRGRPAKRRGHAATGTDSLLGPSDNSTAAAGPSTGQRLGPPPEPPGGSDPHAAHEGTAAGRSGHAHRADGSATRLVRETAPDPGFDAGSGFPWATPRPDDVPGTADRGGNADGAPDGDETGRVAADDTPGHDAPGSGHDAPGSGQDEPGAARSGPPGGPPPGQRRPGGARRGSSVDEPVLGNSRGSLLPPRDWTWIRSAFLAVATDDWGRLYKALAFCLHPDRRHGDDEGMQALARVWQQLRG